MLEIILLIAFSKKLSSMAKQKGHSGAWGMLGAGMWIGGEIFGFMVGAVLGLEMMGMYGIAIVCALMGVGVSFGIVNSLEPTALAEEEGFGL